MSYIPSIYGVVDSNNSSSSLLTANSTFTGTGTDVLNYSSIYISIEIDQSSALDGFSYEFSSNNTNWKPVEERTLTVTNSGTVFIYNFSTNVFGKYFRIVYVNGTTGQGVFRLQTILNAQTSPTTMSAMSEGISQTQQYLTSTTDGSLNVNIKNGLSSFGDLRTVPLTPIIQFNFAYGLNTNYVTTDVATGGTATSTNQMAVMTTTTTSGSSSSVSSKKFFKYRDGSGGLVRFTAIFTTGVANNYQIAGTGDDTNGYFIGYNGTSFGVLYRRNAVDTWVTQTNWNEDTCLGTGGATNKSNFKFDPTKGNIFQISFGYLGFANFRFFIYNPYTSSYILVHTYQYAGANTVPLLTNPSMSILWKTLNTAAAASAVTLRAASGGMFVDGVLRELGPCYGRSNLKTAPGTAALNIITIRNNTTINGVTNKSQLKIIGFSYAATDTTAAANANTGQLNLTLNTTLGGTPVYTNIDANNSLAAFDVAGTTITGGTIIRSYSTVFTTQYVIDLVPDNYITLYPGDILTFASTVSASTANTKVVVSVNWIEGT